LVLRIQEHILEEMGAIPLNHTSKWVAHLVFEGLQAIRQVIVASLTCHNHQAPVLQAQVIIKKEGARD
jgi:hypothetical protein